MSQHEYYIRQPSDTESRGPFTFAQLSALADTGGIDARTLYFDAAGEQWHPISGSDELGLVLKNKPTPAPASALAATVMARPALVLLTAGALALFASAYATARTAFVSIFSTPFFWLALIDAMLALLLVTVSTKALRLIRMRAALGFGFFVTLCWLQATFYEMLLGAAACVCLWFATVFSAPRPAVASIIAGLASLGLLTYCLLF